MEGLINFLKKILENDSVKSNVNCFVNLIFNKREGLTCNTSQKNIICTLINISLEACSKCLYVSELSLG